MKSDDDLLRELLLRVEERDGQPYDFEVEGHDFLDAVRSDDVWDATKKKVAATVGTTSLVVMKEIATANAREKLGLD